MHKRKDSMERKKSIQDAQPAPLPEADPLGLWRSGIGVRDGRRLTSGSLIFVFIVFLVNVRHTDSCHNCLCTNCIGTEMGIEEWRPPKAITLGFVPPTSSLFSLFFPMSSGSSVSSAGYWISTCSSRDNSMETYFWSRHLFDSIGRLLFLLLAFIFS